MGIVRSMPSKTMTYADMVIQAVLNIKDYQKGASRPAIKKYIEVTYSKVAGSSILRRSIKKLVDDGTLLQEGQRFKLDKAKRVELRKPAPKPKKKKVVKKTTTKKKTKKTKKKKTVEKS